jgi:hypothetical protein
MGWSRFDDQRALNLKLGRAGFAARGLDEACICLANRDETDGLITEDHLDLLARVHGTTLRQVHIFADRLIEVTRWSRDGNGLWIHDFLAYNPSHEQQEEKREKDRERKAKSRARAGRDESGQFTVVSSNGHTVTPPGVREVSPVSRPVPSRPTPPSGSTDHTDPDRVDVGRTEDTLVEAAYRILAERRANLGRKPIDNRPGWIRATMAGLAREYPDAEDLVAVHGLTTAAELADWLEPPRRPVDDPVGATVAASRAQAARADQAPCPTCDTRGGEGFVMVDGFAEPCPTCHSKAAVE